MRGEEADKAASLGAVVWSPSRHGVHTHTVENATSLPGSGSHGLLLG